MNRWLLLKDILLTGTGLVLICSQIFSPRPSDVLLVAGGDVNGLILASAEVFTITTAPLGSACALDIGCQSGFCADGVCCDTACNAGSCDACSVVAGAIASASRRLK